MQISIVYHFVLDKAVKSLWIIFLIFLFRKTLNIKSFKSASIILWMLFLVYLIIPYGIRIQFEHNQTNDLASKIIEFSIYINDIINRFVSQLESFLYPNNRLIVSFLILCYLFYKIYIFHKVMNDSLSYDCEKINKIINAYNLKRKIRIYINDDLKTPLTFGVIRPKIVIQTSVLNDDKLLYHVLTHELMHIKKFHILLNHIINIIACIYWFNPIFWISLKMIEEDIEINCDRNVIAKLGDNIKNRKEYCISLFKLIEKRTCDNLYLKMNPNMERMEVMKNLKMTFIGLLCFVIVFVLSLPAIASVNYIDNDRFLLIGEASDRIEEIENERVSVIKKDEYEKMQLVDISNNSYRSANIGEGFNLSGFDNCKYSFDMSSVRGKNHDGFTIKLSNMKCRGGVEYRLIIEEDDDVIYKKIIYTDIILKIKANKSSKYVVTILNEKNKKLSGNIKISSYIR